MISNQRSGPPSTQNISVNGEGACVRLPSWSTSLSIHSDSPVRLYWTQQDFDADTNYVDIGDEERHDRFSANAATCNIWLRGVGSMAQVSVTSIGIG